MSTRMRTYTADDCWRLQHRDSNVHGYELVDGELVPVSPSNPLHGRVLIRVGHLLSHFVDEHGGGAVYGDVGFVLRVPGDPERVRGPDVAVVSEATIAEAGGEPTEGFARYTPELVVEVFSPTNLEEAQDFQQRILDYLDAGVRIVWVLYPETRSATVFHPDGAARLVKEDDALDGEDVLPGLRIPLSRIFTPARAP